MEDARVCGFGLGGSGAEDDHKSANESDIAGNDIYK